MTKEALIVVPGIDSKEVGFALNRMVDSLTNEQSVATVNKIPTPEQPNLERLEFTDNVTEEKRIIDIYEVFWGDVILKNYKEDSPVWQKVIFGIELIVFWFFSPIWKAATKNKWMFTGITFSGLIITFWYFSILGVFISALDAAELFDVFKHKLTEEEQLLMGTKKEYARVVNSFFTKVFAISGVVIGLIPSLMSMILRVSGFSMKFIKNPMVRDDVKGRIQLQMNAIQKDDDYQRVTFLSHSLGVVPTLDFLASFNNQTNKRIRFITIGSPVSFMSTKAKIFRQHANEVLENQHLDEWVDFFSREDWLCSYESLGEEGQRVHSEEIQMDSSWLSRMSTAPHLGYFTHSKVIEKLILE